MSSGWPSGASDPTSDTSLPFANGLAHVRLDEARGDGLTVTPRLAKLDRQGRVRALIAPLLAA